MLCDAASLPLPLQDHMHGLDSYTLDGEKVRKQFSKAYRGRIFVGHPVQVEVQLPTGRVPFTQILQVLFFSNIASPPSDSSSSSRSTA